MNNQSQPPERWAYFVTAVTNRRVPVLTRTDVANIIFQNVEFYRQKHGFRFCGFVLMPDHWHFIMIASEDRISSILRDLKSMIGRMVIDAWKQTAEGTALLEQIRRKTAGAGHWQWSLWQPGNWKVLTESPLRIESQLDYIHLNPVRAKFVGKATDWKLSSANWYVNQFPCGISLDTDWSL